MAATTLMVRKTTADAIQVNIWTSPVAFTGGFIVNVHAERPSNGDQKAWAAFAGRSDNDNSVISNLDAVAQDAGATGWSVEIAEGTDALEVNVQGEVATINWVALITYYD